MLVTGGAGFIGSHLCERLLKTNNKVICLDNLYAGNLNNINHLLIDPSFKFIIKLPTIRSMNVHQAISLN